MKFCFEVGEIRKHQIEYDFNQLFGRLIIRLDRKEVLRNIRLFNEPIRETHLVQVKQAELWVAKNPCRRHLSWGEGCAKSERMKS